MSAAHLSAAPARGPGRDPLQLEGAKILGLDPCELRELLGDDQRNAAKAAHPLEARREIHRGTDGREIQTIRAPDVAICELPDVQGEADAERRERGHGSDRLLGCGERSLSDLRRRGPLDEREEMRQIWAARRPGIARRAALAWTAMAHESTHEPYEALTPETRDMHRAIVSLMEELEAVDWYQQRADVTPNADLKAIMEHNRDEEIEHAIMTLEWIRRRSPKFDENLRLYLFTKGPITGVEEAMEAGGGAEGDSSSDASTASPKSRASDGSLGLGSLRTAITNSTGV